MAAPVNPLYAVYPTTRNFSGRMMWKLSLTVSPLVNEAGVVIGASKIARDITERTRLIAAVKEQAAALAATQRAELLAQFRSGQAPFQQVAE